MNKVRVKKLWNGCVSVRDYMVAEACQEKGLIIELDGESMHLTPEDLLKGVKDPVLHRSKWGDETYHLIDFEWKPNKSQLKLSLLEEK